MRIEPIGVEDATFYAFKQIELASSGMMIRELMKNAMEAALKAPVGQRKIVFGKESYFGVDKLCIWNTGPGMDEDEIFRMASIGCKINKEHGLDKNFGEGAKVAALRSNPIGMVYTSCKNGAVSKVWLTKGENEYGRVVFDNDYRAVPFNEAVLNLTSEYTEEQRAYDWTQVTLLGQREDQNTVTDPYGDKSPTFWIAEELYNRFYRIDPSIDVQLQVGHRYADGRMDAATFETIEFRRNRPCNTHKGMQTGVFSRSDTVVGEDGIKYHFIHDEEHQGHRISLMRNCWQSDLTFGGIIHKDEIYSILKGTDWTSNAFKYGINFGGKYISVLIELPDNFPVVPETNRKNLQNIDRTTLTFEQFADRIDAHRPQWIKDLIEEYNTSNKNMSLDDIEKRLREYMNELLRQDAKQLEDDAESSATEAADGTAQVIVLPHGPRSGIISDDPGKRTNRPQTTGNAAASNRTIRYPMFKIVPLTKDEDLQEKNIVDKAGVYVRTGTGTVYVNMQYAAIQKMFDEIVKSFPRFHGDEMFTVTAREVIGSHMLWRVCSTVVRALAKNRNHPNWSRDDVDRALSSESLSMAADDEYSDFGIIKSKLSTKFVTDKITAVG